MFLPGLPDPGGPGSSLSRFGLEVLGCPGDLFLTLAPLSLKKSSLFWNEPLEVTFVLVIFRRLSLQCSNKNNRNQLNF